MPVKHLISRSDILSYYRQLLILLSEVYRSTDGRYPAMEWLDPKEKPNPRSPNLLEEFEDKYGEFLLWRLKEEIDELFLFLLEDKVIGVVGLNYKLSNKNIPWIPREFMREKYGFIELFVVHPNHQGRGIGKTLFNTAISRLKQLGKKPCVVTFPELEATKFYERLGGRIMKKYDVFVLYCF